MKKSTIEPDNLISIKQCRKITVDEIMKSKTYIRYTYFQIQKFHDESQIINCVQYMSKNLNFQKLLSLYFLLFQIAVSPSSNLSFINFLTQYEFTRKLNEVNILKCQQNQKILMRVMAKFLDCFKQNNDIKIRINNLVHQYHQYRFLQSMKQNQFVVITCQLIRQYIIHNLNFLINEIQYSNWDKLNQANFKFFYLNYSQICTIIKRVSYLKCSLIKLPSFQIPQTIRVQIQQMSSKVVNKNKNKNQAKHQENDQYTQKSTLAQIPKNSVISVKKKLKALSQMIVKMEQHLDFSDISAQPPTL